MFPRYLFGYSSLNAGNLCHQLRIMVRMCVKTFASWWRHQMETFSALLAICGANWPVPVNSPHKGQWRRALMFSLISAWINGWVNNHEAGDLRRNCTHYDVIVMHCAKTRCAIWCHGSLLLVQVMESCLMAPNHYLNQMKTQKQTHWGREMLICVSKLTNIGSDNGLAPGRRQAIIWTNARILLIGPLGTNFSEILIEIYTFPFKKMHLKMSTILSLPQCVKIIVLTA